MICSCSLLLLLLGFFVFCGFFVSLLDFFLAILFVRENGKSHCFSSQLFEGRAKNCVYVLCRCENRRLKHETVGGK